MNKMIDLNITKEDDVGFVDIASNLLAGGSIKNDMRRLHVVHVDNWFGERWLGFRGKVLGAAGRHSRSLKETLVVPPFHPNRVLSECEYVVCETCVEKRAVESSKGLHYDRESGENLNMKMREDGVYVWYSGNTVKNSQGAVMIYVVNHGEYFGMYMMFEKREGWKLVRSAGISRKECYELIELANVSQKKVPDTL
jgi:hypothetical protein